MSKKLILVLLCVFSLQAKGQNYVESDNFKFKFIKAKKASGATWIYSIKTAKEAKRVQVRFKMKSLSGKKENFDPNKFYLVSDAYKVRVRPLDVRYNYAAGWIFLPFDKLIENQSIDSSIQEFVCYEPEIKDTFQDYSIVGYEDISPNINFGTKKKPKIISPYLHPEDLRACKIDIYFALPKELTEFKIYYGEQIIGEIEIK
ncbi:hypothetical protein [Nonlabens marinus]|uniref:DUF4352 domain-containing protein n=1 Tax=Nonlabens marinus S1-08 TaxID=1454201 RepID=W8VVW5_9FLAO|nr:hypothetical protein [Nonlabens marinus]BAO55813.1 hypothetical protein NMS_1804 [Nonlabens marinus S1-08]